MLSNRWQTSAPTQLCWAPTPVASYHQLHHRVRELGALSTDNGQDATLTAINCRVANTGTAGGYGSYAIRNATENFLGCRFEWPATPPSTAAGGLLRRQAPARRWPSSHLPGAGASPRELAAIPVRNTVIDSKALRHDVARRPGSVRRQRWHAVLNSRTRPFLDKRARRSPVVMEGLRRRPS